MPINTGIGLLTTRKEAWMVRPLHKAEYHLFEHRGNHILFDVTNGGFFQVDRVIRDILEFCDGRSLVDLMELLRDRYSEKEVLSAFKELYVSGILSENPTEVRPFTPPGRLEVVHLGLDLTYDGLSGSHIYSRDSAACPSNAYMGEEVARKAIDLLMGESGRIKQTYVTFQGGEPLLNAQLVERVIDYGLEQARRLGKEIFFEVTSDSRLLNEQVFGQLRKQNADIVVKMDGNAPGDLPLFEGSGPYSLSSRAIQDYARSENARVHLHGSVNRNTLDLGEQVRRGLAQYPDARSFILKFSPLPSGDPEAITEEVLPRALAGLEDLADCVKAHVLSGNTTWVGDFEDGIAQVLNRKISFYHCGAGTRYLTVAPDGKLYVCPGLVGNDAFGAGNVEDGINRKEQRKWIKSTHVEKFEACSACWARYLCGGGCRLNSFFASGQIESPDPASCSLIRRTYELAMSTSLDIASIDEDLLQHRYMEE